MSIYVPSVINLFGPVDGASGLSQLIPGDKFYWPGSCDTAHIAVFQSELALAPLAAATWRMCFMQPAGRTIFQLVTCNDGPSNITPVAWIDSNNKPPGIGVWNSPMDVTAQLQKFLAANPDRECNVGWQVCGDNTNPFTVYACRLELTWQVG